MCIRKCVSCNLLLDTLFYLDKNGNYVKADVLAFNYVVDIKPLWMLYYYVVYYHFCF